MLLSIQHRRPVRPVILGILHAEIFYVAFERICGANRSCHTIARMLTGKRPDTIVDGSDPGTRSVSIVDRGITDLVGLRRSCEYGQLTVRAPGIRYGCSQITYFFCGDHSQSPFDSTLPALLRSVSKNVPPPRQCPRNTAAGLLGGMVVCATANSSGRVAIIIVTRAIQLNPSSLMAGQCTRTCITSHTGL